jgi:Asp-tRNA(Asn)/Glu-tRNA(Gln) amidotransferase C subunit
MINVHNEPLHLNADEVSDGNISEDILKNAPKQIYGYFAVPKVIE